jgi:Holliday junction resolvase RusA-like endonuclease
VRKTFSFSNTITPSRNTYGIKNCTLQTYVYEATKGFRRTVFVIISVTAMDKPLKAAPRYRFRGLSRAAN